MLEKYKKLPVTVKAAMWFMFCSLLQKCISFITVPIFTRMMEQQQYGLYSNYLSVLNVMTVICTMNFESCAFINGITKEDESRHSTIAQNLLTLTMVITVCVALVYLPLRNIINPLINMTTPMMLFMFIEIVLQPAIRFWSYEQRFKYKYIALVAVTVSMTVANASLGVLFVNLAEPNKQAIARVVSVVLVQFVFSGVIYARYVKDTKRIFVKEKWIDKIKLHLPLLPHNLSMSLLFASDRVMITKFIGLEAAAIYSVSYSAGMVMQTFKTCIVDALRPWIYDKLKTQHEEEIKGTVNSLMLVVGAVSLLFSLCAPEVIKILAPAQYYAAIYVIPPVAGSSFFMFLYHLFVAVETYYEKTTRIMFASVSAALSNIILNCIFIPIFGYVAAGYTTLFSYILLTILHYRNVRIIERSIITQKKVFDIKTIIIVSVIIIGLIIMTEFVYAYDVLRYSLLGAILICAVIWRKKLINIVLLLKKKK